MLRNCPHWNVNVSQLHNIQGAETVGQVARTIPRIYVALEDRKEDHQSIVVEVEGNIVEQSISVLIDPGSTHGYITPRLVEMCALNNSKHRISWLF